MDFRIFLFIVAMLMANGFAAAQCASSATVSTTESRCRENGSITVTPVPAGAYTYQITAGPSVTDLTTSNVFSGLGPGNYSIEISRGGCTITVPATVPGNYVDPGLISLSSIAKIACPGGTACVTANQPSGGRTPWNYSIIAGPVTKPLQASPTFCGLTGGTYSIQASDSCGVVRTTQFTIGLDTGYLYFQQFSYGVYHSSCNDIVVCPTISWINTSSHSLAKVWWVNPAGDTIKTKNFRQVPTGCDTLIGQGHNYGTWQGIAWDTCGRVYKTVFAYTKPQFGIASALPACSGYNITFYNSWTGGLKIGYTVRKCSDNSVVSTVTQTPPPATTAFSPAFNLQYDTCYIFEQYNECGDTLRYNNYVAHNTAIFNINACGGPGCKVRGSGHIQLWQDYNSGIPPITYTIISGPQGVGTTAVQVAGSSWTAFQNMAMGTYVIAGINACGQKDTVTVTLNNPLLKSFEVIQQPHCSGGANLHLKITSNFIMCDAFHRNGGTGFTTTYSTASPALPSPANVVITPVSQAVPGTWQGDFNNIMYDSVRIYYYAAEGCQDDTVIKIIKYKPPVLTNAVGYVCDATGTGTLNYTISGGKPPFRIRIKPDVSSTWGPWQDSAIFTGISAGAYDVNVEDSCPNGTIRSATFYSWLKSDFDLSAPCAEYGDQLKLTVNPPVNYVSYQWYKDNVFIGSGPSYTIPAFTSADQGRYMVRQTFKNGACQDSTAKWVVHCSILSLLFGELSGTLKEKEVVLKWNTLRDQPGCIFIIERKLNDGTFTKVGSVDCSGSSNGSAYSFTDADAPGYAFYRIKYISPGGKKGYSNTVRLNKNDIIDDMITVSPVPFKNWFTVNIKSTIDDRCSIRLFNFSGKPIVKKVAELKKGNNIIWMDDNTIADLPGGAYILEASTSATGFVKRIKIIK